MTDTEKYSVRASPSPSSPSLQVAESSILFPTEPDVCSQSSSVYDNVLCLEECQGRAHQQATLGFHRSGGSLDHIHPQDLRPLVAEGQTDQTPQLVHDTLQSLPRYPSLQQQQQKQVIYPVFQSQQPPQKPFKIQSLSQLQQQPCPQQGPPQHNNYYQLQQQHIYQALLPQQHTQLSQPEPCQCTHQSPEQGEFASSPQHLTFSLPSPHPRSCCSPPLPLLGVLQQQPHPDDIHHQDDLTGPQPSLPAPSLNTSYTVISPDNLSHNSHVHLVPEETDTQSLTQPLEITLEATPSSVTSSPLLKSPPSHSLFCHQSLYQHPQSHDPYHPPQIPYLTPKKHKPYHPSQAQHPSCLPHSHYSPSCSSVDQTPSTQKLLCSASTEVTHDLHNKPTTDLFDLTFPHPHNDQNRDSLTNNLQETPQIAPKCTLSAVDPCIHENCNVLNDTHTQNIVKQDFQQPGSHHLHYIPESNSELQLSSLLDFASQDTRPDDNAFTTTPDDHHEPYDHSKVDAELHCTRQGALTSGT